MEPNKITLSDVQKGLIAFFAGLVLLLYTLGIITAGLNVVFVVIALGLIAYGAKKAELYEKTVLLIQRIKHRKKS